MELFEDDKFLFDLNDKQKGLYLMLLGLAGKTNNMIRNEISFIKARLNLKEVSMSDIQSIAKIFPKFKCINGYWKFENFEEIHNYILGNSKGTPKEIQRMEQKEKEKENKKENKDMARPSLEEVKAFFKNDLKAMAFFDHYTANGWRVGKNPLKDWQAAGRNWQRREVEFSKSTSQERKPNINETSEKIKQWQKEAAPPPPEAIEGLAKLGIKVGGKP